MQLNAAKGPEGLKEVKQAYSYTLERMGQHPGSGPLWLDYLAFVRTPKPGTPAFTAMFGGPGLAPPQEGSHRTTVIRSATHASKILQRTWHCRSVPQQHGLATPGLLLEPTGVRLMQVHASGVISAPSIALHQARLSALA